MSVFDQSHPVEDPTGGLLRIRPDGKVIAEELTSPVTVQGRTWQPGDFYITVRGTRIYFTTLEMNPEIKDWPKLGVVQ